MIHELAAQRRQAILNLVAQREYATISEVKAVTGASASTVHRDLAHLAKAGVVQRIRGGVTRAAKPPEAAAELRNRLVSLPRVLDRGDLVTVHRLLTQALIVCERLCRGSTHWRSR
ncbi:DeoR family transcriptional regulator [Dactylosporangium sp. AC04546]|uniref:DeoR family transcriptional regulator n=1 Tax=Dactylosporangium sp. AC04546 TaxID=2862460 RepID=UPI001EDF85D4|nr:DeoR family transcriptional regulator [Dactylosporangium sp. AC04546]WVK80542.1 DeoR family transcriptional regulator [Dactylosporangium sp. AC04546]